MNAKFYKPSLQEQYEFLTKVYSVKCPKCGQQWSFEKVTQDGYKEVHTCGCQEMKDLINQRYAEFSAQL